MTGAAGAVIDVVSGPGRLRLTHQIQPVGVSPLNDAAGNFLQHLRVAGRVAIVDKVASGHAADGLGDPVAVAVIHDDDAATVHVGQPVLEVVAIQPAAGSS